jgi:hypothetical protein
MAGTKREEEAIALKENGMLLDVCNWRRSFRAGHRVLVIFPYVGRVGGVVLLPVFQLLHVRV